jgi:putative membrane protein
VSPTAAQIALTGWNLNPSVILGMLALAAAYFAGIGPLRVRWRLGEPVARGRVTAFCAALAVLAFALLSPLDTLGDQYLFAAHMVQHLLLVAVFPPLLLLGTPAWLLRPVLRATGILALARRLNAALPVARGLAFAVLVFALFNADFWLWHLPPLYDLTLRHEGLHILEHLSFLAFATLNWLPILSPLPDELPRLPHGLRLLYLFLSCQPMVALGALLTFAGQPLYAPYIAAPRLFGLSAATDQQLGGLIMWIPGNLSYLLVMGIIFFQWIEQQGAAAERAEWAADQAAEQAAASAPAQDSPDALDPPRHTSATSLARERES